MGTAVAPAQLLLVEDDPDNRALTRELLELGGHKVVDVESGQAALEALRAGHFDALVTDVGLPDIGGLELAQQARTVQPGIAVVLVTGYSVPRDVMPNCAVIEKPVEPEQLEAALAQVQMSNGRPPAR